MVGASTQRVFAASISISRCQPTKKAAGSAGRGSPGTLNSTRSNSDALPPRGKIPCLVPVHGFPCPALSQQWIADHPLVGTIVTVFLTTTTAAWDAHKKKGPKSRSQRNNSQRPVHSIRTEPVLPGASAATTECWDVSSPT